MTALRPLDETLWEIPAAERADMRVPARLFADREILDAIADDRSLEQLQNVATLPGIVDAAWQGNTSPFGATTIAVRPQPPMQGFGRSS